jgi:hypothetical protein
MGGVARPVLLLDVDGVLNPYGGACPAGYAEHALFPDDDEPVRVCPAHGEWIAELAGPYEVVWATGWGHAANRLLGPLLDLPALPVVEFPTVPFAPELKVPVIDRYVGARPAAWIDDLLGPAARDWAADRTAPTLLLPADPAVGLTRPTVDAALSWAREVSSPDRRTGRAGP